ncbi:DUF2778 domain-containing protein [Paraburkholderia humisilvae]|uniref:Tlde1 domain-containing protein n=1 Tax=Paraburkholderia humisilvae TaxID=627669 RepID=A0A6J5E4Y1_9BURK|nr:DUF2778 domain-containing protein [Paraburkholderia humisilvae]CAB3760694.1 hypothetical protein LMG29542_03898 [Paraburkholderia humisilvae]
MPVQCTFRLNNEPTSTLYCSGFGGIAAYSGQKDGRDNPQAVAMEKIGPIPPGRCYLLDRRSGGRLGWFYDLVSSYDPFTTDRSRWFMLWNERTGDSTFINDVKRGAFRLHPEGQLRLSEGCITVQSGAEFDRLERHLRSRPPDVPVPGTNDKAYGIVDVR